jgi:small GTP-binding protein
MKEITAGMLAHVDAGKTTLSEALLFETGEIRSFGRVDHGDSFLDTDEMERERGITIFSKQARIHLGDLLITLVDTPGHVDFSAEMERVLQILDLAVLVISGTDGVQAHTRTLWKLFRHYGIPVIIFVNKMDLECPPASAIIRNLKEGLSGDCVDFSNIIDLPSINSLSEDKDGGTCDLEWLEDLSTCDEAMIDQLLSEGRIDMKLVREAFSERKLYPVIFGSALRRDGIGQLKDILTSLPSVRSYPEEFGARVYKIGRDRQGNRLTYMKITGGTIRVKEPVLIGDTPEKPEQIRLYSGERYETVDSAAAGQAIAVTGLKGTFSGQGLGYMTNIDAPVLEPVLSYSIVLPDGVNPMDFYGKLKQLEDEDPLLHVKWDEETGELGIRLMGRVQLDIVKRQILERFGIEVGFGQGNIVYKETVAAPVEGIGHFEPLRHYAEVHLLIEPGEPGSGIQADSVCSTNVLALNWQRLIMTHILEKQHRGVLTGSVLTDVKITLLTGKAHLKHTEGGDFRQAVYRAIRQGLKSTKCTLLEPVFSFNLDVPRENIGRAMNDMRQMGGQFDAPVFLESSMGDRACLSGTVPVASLGDYAADLNAYTKGTGSINVEFQGYAPCHNQDEVVEQIGYDSEADLRNPTGSVFCAHGAGFIVPWDMVGAYMHLERVYKGDIAFDDDAMLNELLSLPNGGRREGLNKDRSAWNLDEELNELLAREKGRENGSAAKAAGWKNRPAPKTDAVRQKLDKRGNPIYPAKDNREECLVVDGYNVIYGWSELKSLFQKNMDAARFQLLDTLSNYQGYTGKRIMVVFDAYRTGISPERLHKYQNMDVVFTKADETADAYIEKLVHDQSDKYRFTVATSDGLEQLTVMGMGASRMSVRLLKEELERVSRDGYQEYLEKR